jgi:hypothetical protein
MMRRTGVLNSTLSLISRTGCQEEPGAPEHVPRAQEWRAHGVCTSVFSRSWSTCSRRVVVPVVRSKAALESRPCFGIAGCGILRAQTDTFALHVDFQHQHFQFVPDTHDGSGILYETVR